MSNQIENKELDEKDNCSDDIKEVNIENSNNKQTDNKTTKKFSFLKGLILIWIAIGIVVYLLYLGNNKLEVSKYVYKDTKLVKNLDGFTIVNISDLHNKVFDTDNEKLVSMVRKQDPDIILMTGDIVDSYKTDIGVALSLAEKLREITVVYYVNGNHELSLSQSDADKLYEGLKSIGVIVLSNRLEIINKNLCIIGVDEESIARGEAYAVIDSLIESADIKKDVFKILLAHEPQCIEEYLSADLVFCGHAHGGQFRIPFVNKGIIAPNQGLFPKYTAGRYDAKNTTMYVSRGIGNSIIPQRIFNNPEIVKVTLQTK